MKRSKKFLAAFLSVIIIAVALTASTYSWLSAQSDTVVNTFAGGAISITLDEAQVDTSGKKIDGGQRVISNNYKYAAGSVLDKDPTPTVLKGSIPCYVFLCVENELGDLFSMNFDNSSWIKTAESDNKELFIYYTTVDAENSDEDIKLNPIFTQVTVSENLTSDDAAALGEKKLNVTAYAVQTEALTQDEASALAAAQFEMS